MDGRRKTLESPILAPNLVPDPDVKFILDNADRLITVTFRCVVSFGLSDGLNSILSGTSAGTRDDWHQAVVGFHRDTILMAALRATILLDADPNMVSFQAIYHRLKAPSVEAGLLQTLEERHGLDDMISARVELIEEFRQTYREIDWKVHGRLVHFRNRGIAHLTPEALLKSVTPGELGSIIRIISRLAVTLRDLCQSQLAFHPDAQDEYGELAKKAIRRCS